MVNHKKIAMSRKEQIVKRMLQTAGANIHVREAAEGETESRTITGYAILFNQESTPLWQDEDSEAREVIDPAAITKELLDGCDIKFTMYHNRQIILARSSKGTGTLSYNVDEKGVFFEFEAPKTAHGDEALELVRRGDITGCSFMFSTRYYDDACVERTANVVNGVTMIIYRVKAVTGIYDFTLAADPAYPDTSVEARELAAELREAVKPQPSIENCERMQEQLREMRRAAKQNIV
jgi:HK97 family phage prohead protease